MISTLHQQLIRQHYRTSLFRGELPATAGVGAAHNLVCGDRLVLQLQLRNGQVEAARFTGHGCAISQAAASMICQIAEGKTIVELEGLAETFRQMLGGSEIAAADPALGNLRALAGLARQPSRIRCAMLAWEAIWQAATPAAARDGSDLSP